MKTTRKTVARLLPLLAILAVAAFRNAVGGTGLRRYLAPEPSSRP